MKSAVGLWAICGLSFGKQFQLGVNRIYKLLCTNVDYFLKNAKYLDGFRFLESSGKKGESHKLALWEKPPPVFIQGRFQGGVGGGGVSFKLTPKE